METVRIFTLFNKLCLKYNELTIEYNKIYPDNQRCVYFKDQFPNVYQEFMKVFSIVPNENNLNILARYFKLDDNNENELIRLLKENGINNIYHDEEYQKIYDNYQRILKDVYNNLTSLRFPEDIMYIYLKLLTQKLEYVSDTDKNYLLNYILNLLKNNKYFKSIKLSENANLLENYSTLIPKNDMEINKYYQMSYDLFQVNYGGEKIGTFDICPLHLDDIQEKNISINKINCNTDQISRSNNKKFLSDNNNLILQYNREEVKDRYDIETKKYIVGDKVDSDYINNKMNEIMNKYKINNEFSIDLMSNKLYEEIIDKLAKMPTNLLHIRYNNSNIFHNSVYLVDKEIDRKYFNGKLSYFGKFFMSMRESIMPNDKICSNYAITSLMNYKLYYSDQKINIISLYIMYNYIKDQLDEWLKTIKPLLGIDDKWNYDINKDTIRKKVLNENPKLIKKYDKLMNINYTKLFTLDPVINNEDKYNIIKSFSDSIEFYLSQILSKYTDIESYVITTDKEGNNVTLNKVLNDIRDNSDEKKNITYSNNAYLDTYGFKKYLIDMLKDFKSEESMLIYTLITDILYTYMKISHPIEYLTDEGIENIFNEYTYKYILRQTNCPRCVENFYKLYTEGFNKIFEEINIYKQYQEINSIKNKIILKDILTTIKEDVYVYELPFTLGSFARDNINYLYDNNENLYTEKCYISAGSRVTIKYNEKIKCVSFVDENPGYNELKAGEYEVYFKFGNYFNSGCKFSATSKFINTQIYKLLSINNNQIEDDTPYIMPGENYPLINIIKDYNIHSEAPINTYYDNQYHFNNSITINKINSNNSNILYTKEFKDNYYISKFLINKNKNYMYQMKNYENIEKLVLDCPTNNFVVLTNAYKLMSNNVVKIDPSKDVVFIKRGETNKDSLFTTNNSGINPIFQEFKYIVNVIYNNSIIPNDTPILNIEGCNVEFNNVLQDNNDGYTIIINKNNNKVLALIVNDKSKFTLEDMDPYYIKNKLVKIYQTIMFDYNTTLYSQPIHMEFLANDYSYLIINKDKIGNIQGIKLDEDIIFCENNYIINNTNINATLLEDNIYKNNQETDDNISQIIDPSEIFDENYILKYNLHSLNYHGEYYYTIDEYCLTYIKLKAYSNVVIEITESDNSKKFVRRNVRKNVENPLTEISEGQYRVELAFKGIISAGSQLDKNIIKKMKFYKALNVKPKNLEVKKAFIDCNAYYNDKIYATINNNEVLKYNRSYTALFNNGDVYCDNKIEKIDEKTIENQYSAIIYTSNISDSEYPGKYLITKDNNYVYDIKSIDDLKQMIKVGNNNKYILYNNQFYLSSNDFDQYYLNIAGSNRLNARDKNNNEVKIFELKTLQDDAKARVYKLPIASVNIGDNIYGNIKDSPVIIHIEGARFYYADSESNVLELKNINKNNTISRSITKNNNGYVIVKDADIQKPKIILVIITNEEKFKKYINKNIYPINFDYGTNNNNSELITYGISMTNENLLKSYLVLNKPQITYNSKVTQGKSLDTDLIVYDWKYYISNVSVIELEDNKFKDIFDDSLKDKQLQKEFSVKEFNKLMLRKCFPYNFKRTLMCNQDILDAVDGSKYSIPNSKIKETLCEYGKYPYYLEHYFMTSRIDYKLKGKFNIRCLANLSTLPNVIKYLDTDELNYQIKEVLIQGKDMIIKNGKIASIGDVYLVGVELSNDHMFRVPPSKITNKGLLKVIDVQQFDNIYDRVELYLDDKNITDYIVKPLTLETIGTLKNMKYINFY